VPIISFIFSSFENFCYVTEGFWSSATAATSWDFSVIVCEMD
jgi:hypothetical protein